MRFIVPRRQPELPWRFCDANLQMKVLGAADDEETRLGFFHPLVLLSCIEFLYNFSKFELSLNFSSVSKKGVEVSWRLSATYLQSKLRDAIVVSTSNASLFFRLSSLSLLRCLFRTCRPRKADSSRVARSSWRGRRGSRLAGRRGPAEGRCLK